MRPIIQSKKQNKNGQKFFFVFVFLLIIFFSASPNSFRVVSSWLNAAAVPLWTMKGSVQNAIPSSELVLRSKTSLIQENEDLHSQINALTGDLKGFDFLVQENIELKKLFVGKKEGGIFTSILSHPGNIPFDTFLLSAGTQAGIKNGELVLADKNIALGEIIETYQYSAKAQGFSSSGKTTGAFLGPENIPVQLKGLGGGAYAAELPRELDIREGDAAVLPGIDGLILAYVESKEENSADSFQKLYLRNPVNIFQLKYVQVISDTSRVGE